MNKVLLTILMLILAPLSNYGCYGGSSGKLTPIAPAQATSPTPANGATNVITTTQLFWASVNGTTSYDVYFGTTSPGTFKGNQAGASSNPGTLNPGTTYYWRIDSKNSTGTTTGAVWSFTSTTSTTTAVTGWQKVATSGSHTVALKTDGTLWTWGGNPNGQLGDGTFDSKNVPTQISGTNWSAVAVGGRHTVALKTDGTLWAWGGNHDGELGDGTTKYKNVPTQITGTNWSAIAAGYYYTIALKSDGTLWTWGENDFGQLGDGTTAGKNVPTQISGTNWSAIAAGNAHTVALKTDGTLWAWGNGNDGQLGNGEHRIPALYIIEYRTRPIQIAGTNWSAVAAGTFHTVALKQDGTLWTWGENYDGQLGNGTTGDNKARPTQIAGTNWSAIAAGDAHTVALKTDGTLWTWGSNNAGQLGDENNPIPPLLFSHNANARPTQIAGTNWSAIAAGLSHTVALKQDGTLWAWGRNDYGQLCDGTTTDRNTPTQVGQ
ncbi:MAG: hypothetical protein V1701_08635 [Planctomycetota bacterium]